MASAGRLGNSASPFQMAHVSKSYYVPQTNQAYGEYSRSTPSYRPGAYSTADVHQPDGRFRENVGTRWGSSGPRVEARDLKIQKAEAVKERKRRGITQRNGTAGGHQDWQGRTIVEDGHVSGHYNGRSAPGQVHSGSSVGEKKKMDNFKLATVEAGKERDYHEMVMHRGHTPGDKSDKALKNPMHPDMTSAQSDWERKRRIKSQQKAGAAFVSNQNERWENEEQCEKRAQALRDRQMRKQDKHHAEDQEFLSEMKEKAAMKASGQAAVSNGQSAVDAHIAASEQAYAPVVHEGGAEFTRGPSQERAAPAPEPMAAIVHDGGAEFARGPSQERAAPAGFVADAPGIHSRYNDEPEPQFDAFNPYDVDPYALNGGMHPAAFGPPQPFYGSASRVHEVCMPVDPYNNYPQESFGLPYASGSYAYPAMHDPRGPVQYYQ